MTEVGCPTPLTTEMTFENPEGREWRLDFAYPYVKVAVEYQGGTFYKKTKTGHNSIQGQLRDWEKFNEAQLAGWIIIFVTAKSVEDYSAVEQIARAIATRRGTL